MLILKRPIGKSIVIGDDIYCTNLGFNGGQVILGFDAPRALSIHREEIHNLTQLKKEVTQLIDSQDDVIVAEAIINRLIAQFRRQKQAA